MVLLAVITLSSMFKILHLKHRIADLENENTQLKKESQERETQMEKLRRSSGAHWVPAQ
jgi:cell division protein FtsB